MNSLIQLFNSKIKSCNVLVIGDIMLDKYFFCEMKRISPEAPVPIVNKKEEMTTLGGAANVANNLVHLGCQVSLAGVVGNDPGKDELIDRLKFKGIDVSGIITDERCTTTKTRIISGNQQVLRIDHEQNIDISDLGLQHFVEWFVNKLQLEQYNCIIISDYGKGFCRKELCQQVISLANQLEIPIVVDPKGSNWDKYSSATVITPNLKELGNLLGKELSNTDNVIDRYGPELKKRYALDYLLITRSEKGMSLIGEEEILTIPTQAKEVFDVSGAGDTVISTLGAFISIGAHVYDAVKASNIAAGIVVGKVGTYAVRDYELISELDYVFKDKNKLSSKVFMNKEYLQLIESWKVKGAKIIFTNGCFDLLHLGHATYLKNAKDLGDKLIIGLNSDQSVRRLKGPGRPIITENDRAKMLSFFEFVDAVIIFEEDTPLNLIFEIKPDILVKGGDYKAEEVVGKEYAGKVEILTFVEGYSTSNLIERITN